MKIIMDGKYEINLEFFSTVNQIWLLVTTPRTNARRFVSTSRTQVAKTVCAVLMSTAISLGIILVSLIITLNARKHQSTETSICFHPGMWLKNGLTKSELIKHQKFEYEDNTNGNPHCVKASYVIKMIVSQKSVKEWQLDVSIGLGCPRIALKNHATKNPKTKVRYHSTFYPDATALDLTVLNLTVSEETPSILQLQDIQLSAKRKPPFLIWKTFSNIGDGLIYLDKEGMVAVQKSGLYQVMTKMTFMVENKTSLAYDVQTYRHLVIRISDKTEKEFILLESTFSTCQMPTNQSDQSTNMAAVFKLEENDKIYVAVSHPCHLVPETGKHFFSINGI